MFKARERSIIRTFWNFFTALILTSSITIASASAAGTTSANFLKIAPGARPAAFGEAYTSIANDASAVYWNSAGLANLKQKEFILSHNVWFQDIQHSFVAFAVPFTSSLSRYPSNKCIGISATYLNAGDMERRDATGSLSGDSFTASDLSISCAYGRNLKQAIGYPLSAGIAIKFIKQSIAEYSANSVAFDAGLMYPFKAVGMPFNFGLAVLNVGTPITFIRESYPLPLTYKAGISFAPLAKSLALPMLVSFDASFPNDGDMSWRIGTEFSAGSVLQLRAGYMNQDTLTRSALTGGKIGLTDNSAVTRLTGLMAGFGINIPMNRFSGPGSMLNLDYAFVPYGELGNTHRISMGVKW
ncbi:MAG: PorV/PorQ family protein [Elusimicrobiota bacterium]